MSAAADFTVKTHACECRRTEAPGRAPGRHVEAGAPAAKATSSDQLCVNDGTIRPALRLIRWGEPCGEGSCAFEKRHTRDERSSPGADEAGQLTHLSGRFTPAMKRNNKKQRHPHRNKKKANVGSGGATTPESPETDRRDVLARIRNWGVLGVLVAGAGWYLVDEVTATIAEHDLSRVGNGTPTVVQVHDPQCNRCLALQRETRNALETLDDGAIQYVVANIRTAEGRQFAAAHGVGHVTLLLFDKNGKRRNVLVGERHRNSLAALFRSHVRRFGRN
ncbi:MAG: hypothetical protein ACR2PO_02395 [Methyloligellaceae bacterium]